MEIQCSFCGKSDKGLKRIAFRQACICEKCVFMCMDILKDVYGKDEFVRRYKAEPYRGGNFGMDRIEIENNNWDI